MTVVQTDELMRQIQFWAIDVDKKKAGNQWAISGQSVGDEWAMSG